MKKISLSYLKDWWRLAQEASTAISILEYLGFWKTIAALVVSVGNGWLAYMNSQPLWVVSTVFLFTAACSLWAINQWAIVKSRKFQTTPNYEVWDSAQDFTIWDAACLWDERPITSDRLSENGLAIMRAIKQAIREQKISGAPLNSSGDAYRSTRVTRESLKSLAGIWGEQPKFLYPDIR